MAKGESLMGEVVTDLNDSECPEAKRLKVLTCFSDSFLQGSKLGSPNSWRAQGSLSSPDCLSPRQFPHLCGPHFSLNVILLLCWEEQRFTMGSLGGWGFPFFIWFLLTQVPAPRSA
jgi:hypothetical protein